MPSVKSLFSTAFNAAFDASRYTSHRKLSIDSDCNPSQAGKIARGDFDASKDGPSLFGTYRMTEKMGVTLNDLRPPSYDYTDRPGVHDFFRRYRGPETTIHEFHEILEFCDVYDEPKMGRAVILSQGPRSLLTLKTGLIGVEKQQAEYDQWPREKRTAIFHWQRQAWEAGALSKPTYFEGTYGFYGLDLSGWVLLAACRVLFDDLKPRLLLYGDMLGQEQRSTSNKKRKARFT